MENKRKIKAQKSGRSERRKRSETQARIYDRAGLAQNRRRKRKREERGSAPRKELGEILENERKKKSRRRKRKREKKKK